MGSMEQMDDDVYNANKAMFETLMLRMVNKAKAGEDWVKDFDVLITTYNQRADDCKRMVQRLRKTEG